MINKTTPSITVGLRGLAYLEVELTGPNRDLHSGLYGGSVANPINSLAKMITSLHDENHKVTIPGFYDDVINYSDEDRKKDSLVPFDLNDFTRADLEDIALFHLQLFDVKEILSIAEDKYFLDDFEQGLVNTLHKPTVELRKLVFNQMGGNRLTERYSDRLFELINSASIENAVEKVKFLEGKSSKSGVYTSSNELNAFQIIKTILALNPKLKNHVDRVNYKDYKGQFKIVVDDMPSKEICHLILSDSIKKIEFGKDSFILGKVSAPEIAKYKKEFEEE